MQLSLQPTIPEYAVPLEIKRTYHTIWTVNGIKLAYARALSLWFVRAVQFSDAKHHHLAKIRIKVIPADIRGISRSRAATKNSS